MTDPDALAQLKERSNWPNAADGAVMAQMRDLTQYVFAGLLALLFGYYFVRRHSSRARTGISVAYQDGPTVSAIKGMTLLEVSRASGVPHASVCGGRARCFTCRVKINEGLEQLPAPNRAETIALKALEAPNNVRLACQLRPTAPLAVTILNKPAVPGPVQVEFVEIKSVIAAHTRAVLSNETIEIESSDEATLTRWFSDKFNFPVMIPYLSSLSKPGFRLRGGRIDYLQDRPAPTLALTRRGHPISLYVIPSKDTDAFAVRGNRNGYNVVGWADYDFAYFAASDIERKELDALQDECSEAGALEGRSVLPKEQLS